MSSHETKYQSQFRQPLARNGDTELKLLALESVHGDLGIQDLGFGHPIITGLPAFGILAQACPQEVKAASSKHVGNKQAKMSSAIVEPIILHATLPVSGNKQNTSLLKTTMLLSFRALETAGRGSDRLGKIRSSGMKFGMQVRTFPEP